MTTMLAASYFSQTVEFEEPTSSAFIALLNKKGFVFEKAPILDNPKLRFKLEPSGRFHDLWLDNKVICKRKTPEFLSEFVINRIQKLIPERVPSLVFFKGDALVTPCGEALLLAGPNFSGQSTLARELIRLGGLRWSSGLVAINSAGQALPSFSQSSSEAGRVVSGVSLLSYRPTSPWRISSLTPGQSVLKLLPLTFGGSAIASRSLSFLTAMAKTTSFRVEGERGEARLGLDLFLQSQLWNSRN